MVHEKLQWPAAPGQYPRNLVSRLDKFSSLSERVLDSVDHMVESVAFVSGFGCDAEVVSDESVGDEAGATVVHDRKRFHDPGVRSLCSMAFLQSACVVVFGLSSVLLPFLRVAVSALVVGCLVLALGVRGSEALVALMTLDTSVSGDRLTLIPATFASLVFCVPEGAYIQGFNSIETTAGVESSWDLLEIPLKMTSSCCAKCP